MTGMSRDAAHAAIVLILSDVPAGYRFTDVADDILDAVWPDPAKVRQAIFDGIMAYYGMDDSDGDDQAEATEITDAIMNYLHPAQPP